MQALLSDPSGLNLADPETVAALEGLEFDGYAELTRAWGGVILRAGPTQLGKRYFELQAQQKAEARKSWWKGFVSGVFSSLTATAIVAGAVRLLALLLSQ